MPTELVERDTVLKLGFPYLTILKLGSTTIPDMSLIALTKNAPNLEHLELQKCERITEFGVKNVLENNTELKLLDLNKIPIVNYGYLDELKQNHPNLLMRRNKYEDDDFKKDNGLRVPRQFPDKKGKKKKKKGKKGKKKK